MKQLIFLIGHARPYWKWFIIGSLIGFLTTGSNVGLMMTSAYLLAKASFHPSIAELQIAIVGVRFFGIARGVFRYLERLVTHDITFRVLAFLRMLFYRGISFLPYRRLFGYHAGDLIHRVITDINHLQFLYLRVIHSFLLILFTIGLMGLILLFIQPVISFLVVGWMGLTVFLLMIFSTRVMSVYSRHLHHQERKIREDILDLTLGLHSLMLSGLLPRLQKQHTDRASHHFLEQGKLKRLEAVFQQWISFSMIILIGIISFMYLQAGDSIHLSPVMFNVIILGIMAAYEPLQPLTEVAHYYQLVTESAGRLQEIWSEVKMVGKKPEEASAIPRNYSISITDLRFGYDENSSVIAGLTSEIPEKSLTAIVAPSGHGKTTLARLLVKQLSGYEGDILIGGVPLPSISDEWIYSHIAYMDQYAPLFSASLRENILLRTEKSSDHRIIELSGEMKLESFLARFPEGLDTWIGELGTTLSGGEKKLVILLRTLIRDTPMVILDEPTAGLDETNALAILTYLKKLSSEKTIIVVTHEFRTWDGFDIIIRL